MTDTQLYVAVGLPIVLNATMLMLATMMMNRRLDDLKDTWRAELRRVEDKLRIR
jgi:hypothetical protein